jgi:hypothetical protein
MLPWTFTIHRNHPMKKFLVLYHSTSTNMEQMASSSPEQMKAGMDMWMQWAGRAGSSIIELGAPLGAAATVDAKGAHQSMRANLGGYSVLQAESIDALAKVLEGHPHFHAPGASIEVHEIMGMPGM